MPIPKTKDLADMPVEELDQYLGELRADYMKIRAVLKSGGIPEDMGKAKEIRKTIARILTIKNEKERIQKE
jgi:large subunit ribosomal protein L29